MIGLRNIPVLKTLNVCTKKSRESALTELFWNIGISFIPVVIVALIVVLSKPLSEAPSQVFSTVGRGELMVYAASVCGVVLYSLRYNISGPLPEVIQSQATPIGTLSTLTGICMFVALSSYLVRRMSDIHNLALNENLLTGASLVVLVLAVVIAYVVFSLKHSLDGGAADAAREGDSSFAAKWESRKNA